MRLKPCPFCYSTKAAAQALDTYAIQIVCPKCGTRGPVFSHPEHGSIWAMEAWNLLARTVDWPQKEKENKS